MNAPKYSLPEIERRWLADPSVLPDLETLESLTTEDLYIDNSRMRLRKMHFHARDIVQYKLCKKYGKSSAISEPIVNIYLDETEYALLNQLPGKRITRQHYHYPYQGSKFRISIIQSDDAEDKGPIIVEAEFESEREAEACTPPPFCIKEVSADQAFEVPSLLSRSD